MKESVEDTGIYVTTRTKYSGPADAGFKGEVERHIAEVYNADLWLDGLEDALLEALDADGVRPFPPPIQPGTFGQRGGRHYFPAGDYSPVVRDALHLLSKIDNLRTKVAAHRAEHLPPDAMVYVAMEVGYLAERVAIRGIERYVQSTIHRENRRREALERPREAAGIRQIALHAFRQARADGTRTVAEADAEALAAVERHGEQLSARQLRNYKRQENLTRPKNPTRKQRR